MKRTALVRRTGLKRNSKIRVAGISDVAETKRNIQSLLRDIVIARDGGCIFRNHTYYSNPATPSLCFLNLPECNGYTNDGRLILQADHLITRANSATYADSRLVVCVCKGHHAWKSLGSNARKKQYDEIVRELLPPERVRLWDVCERDSWRPHRTGLYDWQLHLVALKQEYRTLTAELGVQ